MASSETWRGEAGQAWAPLRSRPRCPPGAPGETDRFCVSRGPAALERHGAPCCLRSGVCNSWSERAGA
eukprot:14716622-Heterocapsa_arctica.AAC.1